ncbi:unnamed protein product [Ambrosiozyma monospora]|uniref:Unnamed protein product n=1 Tax=Ambrosiozyma monospora TaxID=43982 RepID=A0A9W6YV36_AMBMO|nr:unnamed protein product [Ambrosiozyma monospora]
MSPIRKVGKSAKPSCRQRRQSRTLSQIRKRFSMQNQNGRAGKTQRPTGETKQERHCEENEDDGSGNQNHVFEGRFNDGNIVSSRKHQVDNGEDFPSESSSSSDDTDSDSDSDSNRNDKILGNKKLNDAQSIAEIDELKREERAAYFRRRNRRIKEEAKMIKPLVSKDQFMEYFYAIEEALDHLSFPNIVKDATKSGKRLDKFHERLVDVQADRDIVHLLYQTCNLKDVNVLDKSTARFALSKITAACEFIVNRTKFQHELESIRLTSSLPLLMKKMQDIYLKAQLSGLPFSEERITDVVVRNIPRGQITNDDMSAHYKKRRDKSIKGLYQLLVDKVDQFDVDTTEFINFTQSSPYSPPYPQSVNAIANAAVAVTESSNSKRGRRNKNKKNKKQEQQQQQQQQQQQRSLQQVNNNKNHAQRCQVCFKTNHKTSDCKCLIKSRELLNSSKISTIKANDEIVVDDNLSSSLFSHFDDDDMEVDIAKNIRAVKKPSSTLSSAVGASVEKDASCLDDQPLKIVGKGYVVYNFKDANGNFKQFRVMFWHAPEVNGTFLGKFSLNQNGVDYRDYNGVPHICWDGNSIEIIEVGKCPVIPKDHIIKPSDVNVTPIKICSIHETFGHLSRSTLEKAVKAGTIELNHDELKELREAKDCEGCKSGHARKKDHSKGSRLKYKVNTPFFYVSSDVCQVKTVRGEPIPTKEKYFVLFIDGDSHYIVCNYISEKSINLLFRYYYYMVENQFNSKIKIFKSDGGGEYVNDELDQFLKSKGIIQKTTTARTPQANGICERANKTILSSAVTNLKSAGLSNAFWTYAVDYVVALLNLVVVNPSIGTSPELYLRSRLGQKPYQSCYEFSQFGRLCYLTLESKHIGKLDPRSTPCFYLGPAKLVEGGYIILIWNENQRKSKIIESTHVDFKCPDITFKEWLLINKRMVTKQPDIQMPDNAVETSMPSAIDVDPLVDGKDIRTALSLGGGGGGGNTAGANPVTELTHQSQEPEPTTGDKRTIDQLEFGGGQGKDQSLDDTNPKQSKIHHASRFDETEVGESASLDNSDSIPVDDIDNDYIAELYTNESVDDAIEYALEDGEHDDLAEAVIENSERIQASDEEDFEDIEDDPVLRESYTSSRSSLRLPKGKLLRSRKIGYIKTTPSSLSYNPKVNKLKSLTYKQALQTKDWPKYERAMQEQLFDLKKRNTWDPVQIKTSSQHIKVRTVKVKWVLNKKRSGKFKGRLVGRGDRQGEVTLSESYSPTMTYEVLRLLLAEAIHSRRYVLVLDVNAAYLNADIDREIYIEVPEGEKLQYTPESISKDEIVVLKLNKALYGLVQSGRLWALELGSFLVSIGFKDVQCLYILEIGGEIEISVSQMKMVTLICWELVSS